MTTSANQSPFPAPPAPKLTPGQVAVTTGHFTKAIVMILFWSVVGAAALGAAYVAIRAIYWGVQTAIQPLH